MSKKNNKYKRKQQKAGRKEMINKIIDEKSGCVIIIQSCDPRLKAKVFNSEIK